MHDIINKYDIARRIVNKYIQGHMSEQDFKTEISETMNLALPKTKEEYQISSILNTNKKWTTKSGNEVLISKMTGCHLINAIELLEKNAEKLHLSYLKSGHDTLDHVNGEMAEVSIESELNKLSEIDDIEFLRQYTQYEDLLEEAKSRGLRRNNSNRSD